MRAIRLADGAKGALDAEITARHDENPLPELGKPVDVFNASAKNQRRTRYPGSCGLKRRACGNDSVSTPPRIPVGGMLCPCGAGRLNAESFGTPKENARYGINESEDANDNCWNMRRQRQRQINFCRKNTGRFKLLVRNHAA